MIEITHENRCDVVRIGIGKEERRWSSNNYIVLRHHRKFSFADKEHDTIAYELRISNNNYDEVTKSSLRFREKYGRGSSFRMNMCEKFYSVNAWREHIELPNWQVIKKKRKLVNNAAIEYMSKYGVEMLNTLMGEPEPKVEETEVTVVDKF